MKQIVATLGSLLMLVGVVAMIYFATMLGTLLAIVAVVVIVLTLLGMGLREWILKLLG